MRLSLAGGVVAAFILLACASCGGRIENADSVSSSTLTRIPLRRLTADEYTFAVNAILGIDITTEASAIPRDGVVGAFDNNSALQSLTIEHAQAYQRLAQVAAAKVLANASIRSALVGCDPTTDVQTCLTSFARKIARLAYRHAPDDGEIANLMTAANAVLDDPDPWTPVSVIIQVVLQQPQFLFRIEIGTPDPRNPSRRKLTGYEIATRLAFTLGQTTPDEVLLAAAESGQLDTAEGIGTIVDQWLADPKSNQALRIFSEQWLRTRSLDSMTFDTNIFPGFTDSLKEAARQELAMLAQDFLSGERDAFGLYTAPYSYANTELASVYGVAGPAGSELARVDLTSAPYRGGLFGTTAFAMLTSKTQRTSVVQRGLFVRAVTLCQVPPPPPPGADTNFTSNDVTVTTINQHLSDPACAGCHQSMDPIGFGLERYDAIGKLRTQYKNGEAVPTSGEIVGFQNSNFTDAPSLGAVVAAQAASERCLAQQYLAWTLGRSVTADDDTLLSSVTTTFHDSGRQFRALIRAIVTSETFRFIPSEGVQ